MTATNEIIAEAKCDYFGLCPECRAEPDHCNFERMNVAYCKKCHTKWIIGWNVFSSWRRETEAVWLENSAFLSGFSEVEPYFTPEDRQEHHQSLQTEETTK